LVEIGTFSTGFSKTFSAGPDPVDRLVAEAAAKLDREKEAERARRAIADDERVRGTKRARTARRLMRAIRQCLR
jgi:hypothetical protein